MLERLADIERRFAEIEAQLQDPSIVTQPAELERLGRARAELSEVVEASQAYRSLLRRREEASAMLEDPEMRELAQEELAEVERLLPEAERALKAHLVPKDPNDDRPVFIEIRPAAGGEEASLFAGELMRMYLRYCERLRWPVEIVEHEETGMGGADRAVVQVKARGAYSKLKHESGVHRVQRVPATESGGRIHTSTVTVAVLPEVDDVDVDIKPDDLEITTMRASSAGGQHMQKNETAIRIVHKPSGIMVVCQDERSQAQNKLKAMAVLRSKLYDLELEKQAKERAAERKGQIGSGDRSEKIRTYNFPQSRITDHRIGLTLHNLTAFLAGDIDEMIVALNEEEQARKLAAAEG